MTKDDLLEAAKKHEFGIWERGAETVVLCAKSTETKLARGLRFTSRGQILTLEDPKAGPLTPEAAGAYLEAAAKAK